MILEHSYETPPVNSLIMPLPKKYLRSQIFRSPAKSVCSFPFLKIRFRKPEISKFQMAILAEEDVFGFQVAYKNKKGRFAKLTGKRFLFCEDTLMPRLVLHSRIWPFLLKICRPCEGGRIIRLQS
jgi:hypothetical protein